MPEHGPRDRTAADGGDAQFDAALIGAAFDQAALLGWAEVSVAAAARAAGLPLERARARFPGRSAVLLRFGVLADQAALAQPSDESSERERLFDMLMRRFDAMQPHREGILSLLRGLPFDPAAAALLYAANLRSMAWMLEGAGVPSAGLQGTLRVHGLLGVWLSTLRAWEQDGSPDLSATMAALDRALNRAERAAGWLGLARGSAGEAAAVFEGEGVAPDAFDDAPAAAAAAIVSAAAAEDAVGPDGQAAAGASVPPPPPPAEPPASPPV